jgi:RNA polymerase sigma-70 factor (ECF subfamily)
LVLKAGDAHHPQAAEALATLCRAYWPPLYAFLRRKGIPPHDAQDLTQGFFLHLLEKNKLAQLEPEGGKFRSFLLTAFKNYLADEQARAQTQKRGGGRTIVSLDALRGAERWCAEPADEADPEKIFERRWALTLLERVLATLELECVREGKKERFGQLCPYLLAEDDAPPYAEAGRRLGMTDGAVKVAVLRLRQRYRELFREEIAHTVADKSDIQGEMRHLFEVLRG